MPVGWKRVVASAQATVKNPTRTDKCGDRIFGSLFRHQLYEGPISRLAVQMKLFVDECIHWGCFKSTPPGSNSLLVSGPRGLFGFGLDHYATSVVSLDSSAGLALPLPLQQQRSSPPSQPSRPRMRAIGYWRSLISQALVPRILLLPHIRTGVIADAAHLCHPRCLYKLYADSNPSTLSSRTRFMPLVCPLHVQFHSQFLARKVRT